MFQGQANLGTTSCSVSLFWSITLHISMLKDMGSYKIKTYV